MKKIIILFFAFLLSFLFCYETNAGVIASPSSVKIPRGQSSVVNISFQAAGIVDASSISSPYGEFRVGGSPIATNAVPWTITIRNGSGVVSEAVVVPVSVIERAIRQGTNRFVYSRVSTKGPIDVNFTITTEAASEFTVQRIELYFKNRRAETTVERNYPDLKAFADVKFTGSGLLEGYWEVDGRIITRVFQHLSYGRTVTFQSPAIPPLPTFDTGTHVVKFVITKPSNAIPLPAIIYFVTPNEYKAKPLQLKLIEPAAEASLDYEPIKFSWEGLRTPMLFLVQFYDKKDGGPLFSAYTNETSYTLPDLVLKNIFLSDRPYSWKVTAFDKENHMTGESSLQRFLLKK